MTTGKPVRMQKGQSRSHLKQEGGHRYEHSGVGGGVSRGSDAVGKEDSADREAGDGASGGKVPEVAVVFQGLRGGGHAAKGTEGAVGNEERGPQANISRRRDHSATRLDWLIIMEWSLIMVINSMISRRLSGRACFCAEGTDMNIWVLIWM